MPATPIDLTGQIPDPYRPDFERITDFEYRSRLALVREPKKVRPAARYVVSEPYTVRFKVDGQQETLTVPRGMVTDLVSVPRFGRWAVGQAGRALEAAIVHDFLYIAWQLFPGREPRREHWRYANHLMYAGLDALGNGWRDRFRSAAVRVGLQFPFVSWRTFEKRDEGPLFVELDEALASNEHGLVTSVA